MRTKGRRHALQATFKTSKRLCSACTAVNRAQTKEHSPHHSHAMLESACIEIVLTHARPRTRERLGIPPLHHYASV
eukprot:4391815-Pleurochrysis_carterae.AAC.1